MPDHRRPRLLDALAFANVGNLSEFRRLLEPLPPPAAPARAPVPVRTAQPALFLIATPRAVVE